MTYLLDVNVVIALLDPVHPHHATGHAWFGARGKHSWATSPTVQNGALRIMGSPGYTNSPGTPAAVAPALQSLLGLPGHHFWQDDFSLLHSKLCNLEAMLDSRQVTDTYLLALAASHSGKLATFDRRILTSAVLNGAEFLHVLGG